MTITIKPPSKDEYTFLQKVYENDSRKKVRKRANIILYCINGLSFIDIAQKLYCSIKTVYKWINIWNKKGIGSIVKWRQTTSWINQVKRRNALEKLITVSPKSLSFSFNSWSLVKLSKFFSKLLDYPISPATLSRDLKILGLSYRRVQDSFILKPVDYDIKRACLRFIERYCPPSWRLIYIDEKGPIYSMRYSGNTWSFNQQYRDARQPTRRKVNFLGGYDLKVKKLSMIPMEGNASTYFCDAFDLIRLEFLTTDYTKLLIVLDNARIHTSREILKYLNEDK
ncbi:MAG: hypothetical protein HeimC3_21050 [Candidatus Heimdallarchaeota archaeon LC_3]|nr:MAG: hypothetical protein HeimC3_21050 [Candidatus Heimdallarchaeota archaeon LC_3]